MYRMNQNMGRKVLMGLSILFALMGLGLVGAEEKPSNQRMAVISGKVIDELNVPVDGAKVILHRWKSPTGRWGRFQVVGDSVVTDKKGAYRFEGLSDDYFMIEIQGLGFARAFHDATVKDQQSQQADVILSPPVEPVIHVEDAEGRPLVGARIREYRLRGVNGECRFPQLSQESLGIEVAPSDEHGQLRLPPLPSEAILHRVIIDRTDFAPVQLDELKLAPGASAKVTMLPGVNIILRVPVDPQSERITGAVVDLRREPFTHPSTVLNYDAKFDAEGVARLSLQPGDYSWLLLQHEDFFLTPVFAADYNKKRWLRIEPGRNHDLTFDVRRKVVVRGRVIDAETGRPLPEMSIRGDLSNGSPPGWDDPPPDPWSFAGWGESDQDGSYTIELAAGRARVAFQGSKLLSEHEYYEITVAADGSTVIPDIKVSSIPKIVGVVQNPDGTPAARTIVRLRGKYMSLVQPVLTDAAGRFEIQPTFIPIDEETNQRNLTVDVVAFDPYRPLAARATARIVKSEAVSLTLEPQEPDWPVSTFSHFLSDWERGMVEPDRAAKLAAISLRDRPAPEIDATRWLNTDGQPLHLADLKGKLVLLDFWHTHCGPCHVDFPSVKLVHELYKDHGVVVIGVHSNATTPDEAQAHVEKIKLPIPVAVDFPDGRTVARFEPHGIPDGFPCYVLISREGKVLHDGRTIPLPSLRGYMLEIIRKHLLETPTSEK